MLSLLSCGNRGGVAELKKERHIRPVEIPAVMKGSGEAVSYAAEHFWDSFFSGGGQTDTGAVLGVGNDELHRALAAYLEILLPLPLEEGRKNVRALFGNIEKKQEEDTSSRVYMRMTELVSDYLYDPNSPYRDEDLYLPFVQGMLSSPFTMENVKAGYRFEEEMGGLNERGSVAANFRFKDLKGRKLDLYGIDTEYVLLFFSNPGCRSCGEIGEKLQGSSKVADLQDTGRLKVLNVYIDKELEKWRKAASEYPSEWLSVYDYEFLIRENTVYYVRAIPSLYLLGPGKKVVLKDAPVERVLEYLNNL